MSRPLTVLYAGAGLSGRTESLCHLTKRPRVWPRPWEIYEHGSAGFDWCFRGQTRHIHAHVLYTGSLGYPSLEAKLRSPVTPHREGAERVVAALPKLDGIVLVASGAPFRDDALAEDRDELSTWVARLARVGVAIDRLPVVFQLNRRDVIDAPALADFYRELRTPRCDYAPSVASRGLGVDEALATLVAMIDGAAPAPLPPSSPSWRRRAAAPPPTPDEIQRLFQPSSHDLLPGAACRERFVVVSPFVLEIASGRFMLAEQCKRPLFLRRAPRGRHAVTLLQRIVEYDRPDGGVDQVGPTTIAARVAFTRRRTATVTPIAGTRRQVDRMMFGDPTHGASGYDAVVAARGNVGWSVLPPPYQTGLFPFRIEPGGAAGELPTVAHASEAPLVLFDVGTANDPVRAYWERGDDGASTAFTIFADYGAAVLGRRAAGVAG